jgi:hypothetical protein
MQGARQSESFCFGGFFMRALSARAALIAICFLHPSVLPAQEQKPANLDAAPPNIALLTHVQIYPGKAADRERLAFTLSRGCDRLDAQKFWIDLESLTGDPEGLIFSAFDSYEQLGLTNADWGKFLASHPDLDRMRGDIEALTSSQSTIIAVRRDDLGYLSENIDLSEASFMSVLEVHLFPGHENDFAQAIRIQADAYAKIHAEAPWVVYQVDGGAPAPTFLVFRPMAELKQNDDLLSWSGNLAEAEGEQASETLQRIARESYASTESNIFAVHPEMSHVSKSFAATDPDYWLHRAPPESKPEPKPDPKSVPNHVNR